ncbi:CxxCxxCC domain-containing protein, partial [Cobetia marina]
PGCIPLDVETVGKLRWLPETCGYRRLNEGRELPEWHPLLTGDARSVKRAGVAVSRFAVSEASVRQQDLEDHIIAIIDPES